MADEVCGRLIGPFRRCENVAVTPEKIDWATGERGKGIFARGRRPWRIEGQRGRNWDFEILCDGERRS